MIRNCYISPAVNFVRFTNVLKTTGKDPLASARFKSVNTTNNPILNMIVRNIPVLHMKPSFCINNTWYQFQLVGIKNNVVRFAQFVVTQPSMGKTEIRSVRYVDLLIA